MGAEKTYSCFVISPIGERDSDVRADADACLNKVILPALRENFVVRRGDQYRDTVKIDDDTVRRIRQSDLCVCYMAGANENVFYELGFRDAVGKPMVLLKADHYKLPIDIGTRYYISIDLQSADRIREAQEELREMAQVYVDKGFSDDLAEEQKLEQMIMKVEQTIANTLSGFDYARGNTDGREAWMRDNSDISQKIGKRERPPRRKVKAVKKTTAETDMDDIDSGADSA